MHPPSHLSCSNLWSQLHCFHFTPSCPPLVVLQVVSSCPTPLRSLAHLWDSFILASPPKKPHLLCYHYSLIYVAVSLYPCVGDLKQPCIFFHLPYICIHTCTVSNFIWWGSQFLSHLYSILSPMQSGTAMVPYSEHAWCDGFLLLKKDLEESLLCLLHLGSVRFAPDWKLGLFIGFSIIAFAIRLRSQLATPWATSSSLNKNYCDFIYIIFISFALLVTSSLHLGHWEARWAQGHIQGLTVSISHG